MKIKDDYAQMLGYKCFIDLLNDCSTLEIDFHINNLIRIENNNKGWIKIESEDDLPNKSGYYYAYSLEIGVAGSYYIDDLKDLYKSVKFTHYKKAEKPKPPLY